ncbi:leucine-rich repeat protein [Paenibacillus sp. HB172176]|uniref:leucine-rich repeat protein n=1 Tax=Paenibacillus sp. HB172176 TaxID=2493690 RepID=UPI00143C21FA|nr:leucine-rich repeat protein [Paenibacillus sp. HB172176]
MAILLLLTGIMLGPAKTIHAATEGDFTYYPTSGTTAYISSYSGTDTDIIIPDRVGAGDEYEVTAINEAAFNSKGLTSVVLPSGLKTIGQNAFYQNALTSIELPPGLESIGKSAFANNKLTEVVIPDLITTIENNTFQNNKITSLTLPNSITSIGRYAFSSNLLTNVSIPNQVTSIGMGAFMTNRLTSASLSDELLTIENQAFSYNKLASVTIPSKVTSIGASAFMNNQLASVNLPDSLLSIGDYAFHTNKLTSLIIPDGITAIGAFSFYNNELTNVELPDQINTIGDEAFAYNSLTNVVFPEGMTAIGDNAFYGNHIGDVSFPASLETIGEAAFKSNWLTSFVLPRSLTSLGNDAFRSNNLTSVIMLGTAATFGTNVFYRYGVDPSETTIIGYSSSTTETYADAIGHTFEVYGKDLLDGLTEAGQLLADHAAGTAAGEVPQTSRDALQAAISAAQPVADDIAIVDPLPLANATTALLNAISDFKATIIAVTVSLAVPADGTYDAGDVLTFTVTYNDSVTVNGDPSIELEIGTAGATQTVQAVYAGLRGTPLSTLDFEYEIPAGLLDTDGIGVDAQMTLPSGASITGSDSGTAPLAYTLPDTSGIHVDSGLTDSDAVAADLAALAITYAPGDSASSVTQNVGLPTSGGNGTSISWTSSDDAIIDADGSVTRPPYTGSDAVVTLTATISKGATSDSKTFELTVIKQVQTDGEAVAADLAALAITYAPGDSASSVTQNVGLPSSGGNGTSISWTSSDGATVDTDGVVTRPPYTGSDAAITLTATVSKGATNDTKNFELTVIALPAPPSHHDNDDPVQAQPVHVTINGKEDDGLAAYSIQRAEDGSSRIVIQVADEIRMKQAIHAAEGKLSIIITVDKLDGWDGYTVELSEDLVTVMVDRNANVKFETTIGDVRMNMGELDMNDMDASDGEANFEEDDHAFIQLDLAKVSAAAINQLDEAATAMSVKLLAAPIQFHMYRIEEEGERVELKWNNYATLTIGMPASMNANEETTFAAFQSEKGFRFIPAHLNNIGEAILRSMDGGMYVLIGYNPVFADIHGRWSAPIIENLSSKLIIQGDENGLFHPESEVTKAEFIAMLVRALALPIDEEKESFTDVSNDAWYSGAVAAAANYGLTQGDEENKFHPSQPLSRQEAAVIIAKAQALMGLKLELSDRETRFWLGHWKDDDTIAEWARDAMASARKQEILLGDAARTARPEATLTREEMAAILYRMLLASRWID